MPTKKYVLQLRKISPTAIDEKYKFSIVFNLNKTAIPEQRTPISELDSVISSSSSMAMSSISSIPRENGLSSSLLTTSNCSVSSLMSFSFLDESKKDHQCVVTMLPYTSEQQSLPATTGMHCFWCRHSFHTQPIGCPIRYDAHRYVKTYESEITRDNYTLRENISDHQLTSLKTDVDISKMSPLKQQMYVQPRNYYITDGVFCSFNCTLAFILDNKSNPLYVFSLNLLMKMYHDMFPSMTNSNLLEPAPSWRLLKTYGGHMTIEEFRKNFYRVEYQDIDNVLVPFPNAKPMGMVFEKQIRI